MDGLGEPLFPSLPIRTTSVRPFRVLEAFVLVSSLMSRRSVSKDDMLADAYVLQFLLAFSDLMQPHQICISIVTLLTV